jgi:PAS domain S-box-containing protein
MSVMAVESVDHSGALERLGRSFEAFRRITTDLETAYDRLRERAERIDLKLAETNRRLATILRCLPVGVVEASADGRIAHVNRAAERLLGVDPSELRDRPLADLSTASGERLLREDGGEGGSLRRIGRNGSTRLVRIAVTEIPDDGGRILTLEDHTEVEDLRQEVHRLDKLAALGEMSARLAHQIRNPLNGMQGFAELLARRLDERPSCRRQAEKVLEGARDLNRIVTNMLAFARPAGSDGASCPLGGTVDAAVAWLRDQVDSNETYRVTVRHDAPDTRVLANRFPLEEALRNLLVNAVEAMPHGGVIRVRTRVRDGYGEVTVADRGPGIPSTLRDRIFEPFVTGRERGTGLGLAIVRSVAEQAGGDLALRPSARGARFRLRMRLANEEAGGPA